jgi:hypothetical protein
MTRAYAQETPAPIDVRGDILKPREWSIPDLRDQFAKDIKSIRFSIGKGQPEHTGTGIPLISLLQAAAPKVEKTPKHYELSFLVIIEAHDGYRVYFSLAELLPECGRAQAWLVWEMDGKALPDKEAPVRLVVPSDHGHDRWIWGIGKVTLVDGTRLANKWPRLL